MSRGKGRVPIRGTSGRTNSGGTTSGGVESPEKDRVANSTRRKKRKANQAKGNDVDPIERRDQNTAPIAERKSTRAKPVTLGRCSPRNAIGTRMHQLQSKNRNNNGLTDDEEATLARLSERKAAVDRRKRLKRDRSQNNLTKPTQNIRDDDDDEGNDDEGGDDDEERCFNDGEDDANDEGQYGADDDMSSPSEDNDEADDGLPDGDAGRSGRKAHDYVDYQRVGESEDEQEVCLSSAKGVADQPEQYVMDTEQNGEEEGEEEFNRHGPNATSAVGSEITTGRSNPSIVNQGTTGIRLDESIVQTMSDVMKQTVTTVVQDSVSALVDKVQKQEDILRSLKDYVTDLTMVVQATANAVLIKQPNANSRTKEIHKIICILPALFNDLFMTHILAKCCTGFILNNPFFSTDSRLQQVKGVDVLNVFFFSKQPYETKKDKFESQTGLLFSKFRGGLLMSSILAMQKNSFNTFITEGDEHVPGQDSSGQDSSKQQDRSTNTSKHTSEVPVDISALQFYKQPFWLRSGFVRQEHCQAATRKNEKCASEETSNDSHSVVSHDNESQDTTETGKNGKVMKVNRSGPVSRDEIATESATLVCKIVTQCLHKARASSKQQLFYDFLYLFTGWGQFGDVQVNQKTMILRWAIDNSLNPNFISDLPKTRPIRIDERFTELGPEQEQVNLDNLRRLQGVIDQHPELTLLVEHDVYVEDSSRGGFEAALRRLKFRISLIEVAAKFLSAFTSLESNTKTKFILGVDRQVIKACVIVAFGLRLLVQKSVADMISSKSVMWADNVNEKSKRGRKPRGNRSSTAGNREQYEFQKINGMSIASLMTSHTKQKELLGPMLLSITPAEFDVRNEGPRSFAHQSSTTYNDPGSTADVIEANASMGVFEF